MGVLHVVHGVVVGLARPHVQVEVDALIRGIPGQGVPGGVRPDGVHEVGEQDHVAGALAHPQRLAVLDQVDHLADQDLEGGVGIVTEARRQRPQPADVAMVVRAEHDDDLVEATLALVQVVGAVSGEVGPLAVAPDEHPVAVVAMIGRAQPGGSLGLVDLALRAQPVKSEVQLVAQVQVAFIEVDVEDDTEAGERVPDLGEHQLDAVTPEHFRLLLVGQREDAGALRHDRRGDLVDVGPRVAVLRHRAAVGDLAQRSGETLDLAAGVVEVVLPRDLGAAGLQQPRQGVADGSPPHRADVDGSGGVGRDELEVEVLAGV